MTMKVALHIKDHCVETEAKNELKRLMDRYFSEDDVEGVLEDQIEILREFIETSDFSGLRSSDPRLSGDTESTVVLQKNGQGKISLQFS
ncbi:MAG: hypothetical protein CVV44_21840 [Spirochaetae bacterium HGW-Spirochaetae-1]|jgi:primase-polymerase (primpol)-like protein|nr:MAG: hypothetical protein CVV44_21840 [Spirochaetae bacterium HGW-Spirochaetae-1]